MKLRVHIERLIIDAPLTPRARAAIISQALRTELDSLLRQRVPLELPSNPAHHPRVAAGHIPAQSNPANSGQSIARAVHHGLLAPTQRAQASEGTKSLESPRQS